MIVEELYYYLYMIKQGYVKLLRYVNRQKYSLSLRIQYPMGVLLFQYQESDCPFPVEKPASWYSAEVEMVM